MPPRVGYFDCNATTPLCEEARRAWLDANEHAWYNPTALYQGAVRARVLLEEVRSGLAEIFGCAPDSIIFTSGATEANNAFFHYLKDSTEGVVLLPKTEHASVRHVAEALLPGRYEWLELDVCGAVRVDHLEARLARGDCHAVSVMAVNNETGVIQPWGDIQALCARYKVLFHTDATQWVGKMPAKGLGSCDFFTLSAHKFGGPKGIGLLKVPSGGAFSWLYGGGQEYGRRSGTENYASVAAMFSALRAAEEKARSMLSGCGRFRDAFEERLKTSIPGVCVLCEKAERIWNTSMLILPKHEGWRWVKKLDALGYAVGLGSACATMKGAENSIAVILGVDLESAKRGVRVSSGWGASESDWKALGDAFCAVWEILESEAFGDSVVDIHAL